MPIENNQPANIDPDQLRHFAEHDDWWQTDGSYRALHDINAVRTDFIVQTTAEHFAYRPEQRLNGCRVLDVGCGGGILSLALAAAQGRVTAIDADQHALAAAKRRAEQEKLQIDFQLGSAEQHRVEQHYDLVVCCELLEHVPRPDQLIGDCASLCRPGGVVIFSTLTRTPISFLAAIVVGEYMLDLVPRGTHRYVDFIRPSELERSARQHGLQLLRLSGLSYRPWWREARLTTNIQVNYLAAFGRPESG